MNAHQNRSQSLVFSSRHFRGGIVGALCLSLLSTACDIEPKQVRPEDSLQPEQPGQDDQDPGQQPGQEPGDQPVDDLGQLPGQEPAQNPPTDPNQDPNPGNEPNDPPAPIPSPEYEPPHLQYLTITTGDQVIEQDLGATTTIEYKATGYFSNGESKDISNEVTWSVADPAIGNFDKQSLVVAPHDQLYVQTTLVTAKLDKITSQSQLTVTAYQQGGDNPDFVFILPYNDKEGAKDRSLSFKTKIPSMDVFFAVDATGSMNEERSELLDSIESTIVPGIKSKIPDTQFGVGSIQDFPVDNYGASVDQPFELLTEVTDQIDTVTQGVRAISIGNGRDIAESIFEGLYQIATGEGLSGPGGTNVASNNSGVGGVGFRAKTMPVIVSVTDAPSHGKDEGSACGRGYAGEVANVAHSYAETETALNNICARVITVASQGFMGGAACSPISDGNRLADSTKTKVSPLAWADNRPAGCAEGQCCTGINGAGQAPDADGMCPLVYQIDAQGRGLDESVVSGIEALAFYAPFDVATEQEGQTLPSGEMSTRFIQAVTASGFSNLPRPELPAPVANNDRFEKVTPGTQVQFTIRAFNDFVKPTGQPQVFRAKLRVKADQCEGLELDEREVVFVVPPRSLVAG